MIFRWLVWTYYNNVMYMSPRAFWVANIINSRRLCLQMSNYTCNSNIHWWETILKMVCLNYCDYCITKSPPDNTFWAPMMMMMINRIMDGFNFSASVRTQSQNVLATGKCKFCLNDVVKSLVLPFKCYWDLFISGIFSMRRINW